MTIEVANVLLWTFGIVGIVGWLAFLISQATNSNKQDYWEQKYRNFYNKIAEEKGMPPYAGDD